MKLTCDLCGGALQMNLGGQSAACTNCGLTYSMDRLREMLTGKTPDKPEPQKEMTDDVTDQEKMDEPKPVFAFTPEQFVMENSGRGNGDFCGLVQRGGIGLGDSVYIDGDYDHPCRVYSIDDNPYTACAKAGMYAELYIVPPIRWKKLLKNARMVTGDPNPVANAYNYPGTVREYFSNLLLWAFSQYEIHTDVLRDELNIPVTYLFRKSGKPVLAVFLIDSNDSKGRYQVEKAARIFALEGVACTHFFEDYRNDMPYVIHRVRGALGERAQ